MRRMLCVLSMLGLSGCAAVVDPPLPVSTPGPWDFRECIFGFLPEVSLSTLSCSYPKDPELDKPAYQYGPVAFVGREPALAAAHFLCRI